MNAEETVEAEEKSIFGYYVTAALIAVRMGISLDYAFKRYVKHLVPANVKPFTEAERETLGHLLETQ